MRRFAGLLVLVAAVPAGLALAAQTHTVDTVGSTSFDPKTLTIAIGDSVTWHNNGGFHSVDFDDNKMPGSDPTGNGTIATRTFNTAGTFRYYCEIHGGENGFGMSGTVVVQDPTATPTATATATGTATATTTATPSATATPYYAVASVTGLRVRKTVRRGFVRGSLKAQPTGRKVRIRITRRGLLVARATKFALPTRVGFSAKLSRSVRRALRRGRHPRVKVTAKLGRASASKTVRLRRRP